jgi:hypothetical protein
VVRGGGWRHWRLVHGTPAEVGIFDTPSRYSGREQT